MDLGLAVTKLKIASLYIIIFCFFLEIFKKTHLWILQSLNENHMKRLSLLNQYDIVLTINTRLLNVYVRKIRWKNVSH